MQAADAIQKGLKRALESLGIEGVEAVLEHPADLANGDFSTNIALAAAKREGVSVRELAEKIVAELSDVPGVSKIEIAGPGFINFHLSREALAESIAEILKNERWGSGDTLSGQKIMYEYTDPNPFKVFHIGHLMSNAVGESLSRIAAAEGATVVRANYQGDIGLHVAKCVWALRKENLSPASIEDMGKAYVIGASAYEDDPNAKEEIDALNKRLYAKDPEYQKTYGEGRKTSLEQFEKIYQILGTKFDYYFFESEVGPIGMEIVREGLKKGVFEESEGAIVYKGEKVGLHTRVFITKADTPTYEAKELGLNKTKFEKESLDHSIIITANEIDEYFKVLLAAMREVLPEVAAKTEHVSHGFMQLIGGKMSSRKGNVVTGESLIEDMRAKALEKMEGRELGKEKQAIADQVAVAAIKYSILKQATGKNIVFDPEQSLSFEGDSGPYLQYAHVRARAVLRKAAEEKVQPTIIYDSGLSPEVVELERLLYRFPEIVLRAEEEKEPHYITTFLTELAGAFNSWYAREKIVDSEDEASPYKVALTEAFAITMRNGLHLLGIQSPEKM
jgi:arginyl-tRNA synthetase